MLQITEAGWSWEVPAGQSLEWGPEVPAMTPQVTELGKKQL